MYILTNFVPKDIVNKIEKIITDNLFPWYWSPSSKHGYSDEGKLSEDFQFTNSVDEKSELYSCIKILLDCFQKQANIKIKSIYRIKVNLLTKQNLSEEGLKETIHIDKMESNFMSIVYYVLDSDGDTIIYDNDKMILNSSPIKGNAVCFLSKLKHRATPPKINKRRIVLNIIVEF